MSRIILSMCLILITSRHILTQATVVATNPTAKNYCENSYCNSCMYVESAKMKSCSICTKSVKKAVSGQTEVFECVDKKSVSMCNTYYPATESDAGCKDCETNYFPKLKAGTNPKPTYECIKSVVADVAKPNCQIIIKTGTLDAQV